MYQSKQSFNYNFFNSLIISFCLVVTSFIWQGNKGFNLWDEGFLWYGVQRIMLGEVPMRDFMAYDPGRYYWTAALSYILGNNGIMNVRIAVAIFQSFGLFVGILLIAKSLNIKGKSGVAYLILSGACLLIWMFPRHKLFDISISILLIGLLTYLVNEPQPKKYFITGLFLGLIAFFGRNHGLYGAVASVGVIAWLSIKNTTGISFIKAFFLWSSGILVGFLPTIIMAILIPGFAVAFWESILFLFQYKNTNLPLPIPWPWTVEFFNTPISHSIRGILIGLFFMGTLIFGVLSLIWVFIQKYKLNPVHPTLVATAFLALPYAHYAFSRADVGHLAHGIFPFLIGSFLLLASSKTFTKWVLLFTLCASSFWVMFVFHPGWQCFSNKNCVNIEISGKNLLVDEGTVSDITLLRRLNNQYASKGESFIAAPFWPGAYALLQKKSPTWEIYSLFPRTESFEIKEIERIVKAEPKFVFILDIPLDGRDDLRFKNTHPLTHQYIINNFQPIAIAQNPAYKIYQSKGNKQ